MVSLRPLAFLPLLRPKTCMTKERKLLTATLDRRHFLAFGLAPVLTLAQPPSFQPLSTTTTCLEAETTKAASEAAMADTGYLDAKSAAALDEELMSSPGFTLEQLMELAGLSVAEAVFAVAQERYSKQDMNAVSIVLVCGPGNNGGDGLVAARHLKLFGYEDVTIVYPKRSSRQPHYTNLVQQCVDMDIPILDNLPDGKKYSDYQVIVDAIFGFSFKGEPREPFATILTQMQKAQDIGSSLVVAVDVPSGWHVDDGDILGTGYLPEVLVSLTAPKLSAKNYPRRHFVGGRFLPPGLAQKYNVRMPPYPGVTQVMEVSRGGAAYRWEQEYAEYLSVKEAKESSSDAEKQGGTTEGWEKEYAAYLAEKEKEI